MARIPQPSRTLIQVYNKENVLSFARDSVFHDIYRAYQRVDGKFIPIGWSVQAFDIQRNEFPLRVYTDQQVREYELEQFL